jgi:hypothetical protein
VIQAFNRSPALNHDFPGVPPGDHIFAAPRGAIIGDGTVLSIDFFVKTQLISIDVDSREYLEIRAKICP